MGRDTEVRDAVRNEGGVESAHYGRSSSKLMNSTKSDVLTESVTEDSADDHQTTKRQSIKRAKKGLKILRSRVGSKTVNQKTNKSKANAVATSLAK